MAVPDTSSRIAEAQKLAKSEPDKAEHIFKDVLSQDPGSNETAIKNYESALVGLGELYRDQKRVDALAELVRQARSIMSSFAKAKTSKLGMTALQHGIMDERLTLRSPTVTRLIHHHPQHGRHANRSHQVMHRMGRLRAERLPTAEPRNSARVPVHAEAILLRGSRPYQQSAEGAEALG